MRHLTSEQLIDLAEGVRPTSSTPHLESCEICRNSLAELRATLSAAASVDVPEPSPLFWDHFSARVHDAVEAEAAAEAGAAAFGRWSWLRVSPVRVGTLAVIVLAIVIMTRGGRPDGPASPPEGATASDAGSSGDPSTVGDDPSLSLMADLAADMDWDAASEAGLTTHVGVDNDAVTNLTDAERRVLNQLLKGELAHRGA
jgi:hypothetical protein